MRRLVLPRSWPFRWCNQERVHIFLFIPLIAFITCLLITIFVFFMSALAVSSSQAMREEMFVVASWKEGAANLATKETFSNKTRTRTRTRTPTSTAFPLPIPFQAVDSRNDQTESSRTKGIAKVSPPAARTRRSLKPEFAPLASSSLDTASLSNQRSPVKDSRYSAGSIAKQRLSLKTELSPPAARTRRSLKPEFAPLASSSLDTTSLSNLDQDENPLSLQEQGGDSSNQMETSSLQENPRYLASSLAKRKLLLKTEPSILNSAVINGIVNLPCDISPANSDDSVALILWYKDDSLAPIYTIDARKANSLDKAKVSLDEAYANRASFNMKAKPAQLQLEPVKQEDEGEYRCRVDFKRGRTVNTIIALRVIALPEDIRIVTPQRQHTKLEGLIGPFNEGSELTLICLATGGKPRPQISWRRDFNVIDETYQHLDKEGTSNELKIPSLNKNYLLSIFTCQASNNNITNPLQTSITLDLNLKPQEVSLKQLIQEPLVVGQTATFECLTHGSRPQATIHWLFQGIRHDKPMNVDQQQTSSRLTLTLQRSFNQQTLTCVAENPRIPQSSALHQTIKLDVHYPPQLNIKLESPTGVSKAVIQTDQTSEEEILNSSTFNGGGGSNGGKTINGKTISEHNLEQTATTTQTAVSHLQEGNDIYLTCQMDANPRPVKPILWRFNGRSLQLSSNMVVMNNQSLVLRKVSRQQSGSYTCDASNQYGSNSSKPISLIIRHAPVCSTEDILIFEASVGQIVTIDCKVTANPSKSVHYSWFLASDERNLSSWIQRDAGLDEQLDESSSRLKLKIKDKNNFGLLKCKAKNEVGLQQKPCLFQIIQAPNPTLKHTCSLLNTGPTYLQIMCQPSEHLKSEEFEFIYGRANSTNQDTNNLQASSKISDQQQQSSMARWLNIEAMRQQTTPIYDPSSPSTNIQPNFRLVFPPNWILGELFKISTSNNNNNDISDNKYKQNINNNQNYELVAYIVVGAANQLANIKSIVEENKIFSSNPRSVYYVIAKNHQQAGENNIDNDTQNSNDSSTSSSTVNINDSNITSTIIGQSQAVTNKRVTSQSQSKLIIQDSTIKLADSFAFTVPSLEPQTKYKLFIYGQNLANKTRDWSLVKGETLQDDGFSPSNPATGQTFLTSKQSATSASFLVQDDLLNNPDLLNNNNNNNNNNNINDSSSKTLSDQQQNNNRQQSSSLQKSIVMRSDNDSALSVVDQIDHQTDRFESNYIVDKSSFGSSLKEDLTKKIHSYKEYAISYAKQKPLLATSLSLTILLVVSLLIVRTGNMIVSRARGSRTCSSPKKANGSGNGNIKGGGAANNNMNGSFAEQEMTNKGENNRPFNSSSSPNDDSYFSNSHQEHSSPNSSKSNSNSRQQHQHHQQQQQQHQMNNACKQEIYAIETSSVATMLDNQLEFETTAYSNERTENNINKVYPVGETVKQQQNLQQVLQHRCLLGSLDRRNSYNSNQQAIYLTETGGACPTLLELHQNKTSEQNKMNFGSIDRRGSRAGCFIGYTTKRQQQQQQQQQQLQQLIATDLGQLEHGALYLEDASGGAYSASSFSSTQCSGSEQQGPIVAKSRQRVAFDLSNQNQNHQQQQQQQQQQHQEQQRVATLKPVQQYMYGSVQLTSSPAGDECLVISPVLGEETQPASCLYTTDLNRQQQHQQLQQKQYHQRQQQHPHLHLQANSKLNNNTNGKGSDSGGSNSGNTADSGHESPPTGDINSTSFITTSIKHQQQQSSLNQLNNFKQHKQQTWNGPLEINHAPQCQIHHRKYQLGEISASPLPSDRFQNIDCCNNGSAITNRGNNEENGNNFVMLMELSPGSQESSTLLQSVDSFNDMPSGTVCTSSEIRNLHTNHQMATSFSTSHSDNQLCNGNQQQQQQQRQQQPVYLTRQDNSHCSEFVASPEVDNWL